MSSTFLGAKVLPMPENYSSDCNGHKGRGWGNAVWRLYSQFCILCLDERQLKSGWVKEPTLNLYSVICRACTAL